MEYVVVIEKLDHQGRGIAFTDGIITFIPNALIGEKVKIKIVKSSKKVKEAEVIEYLIKSHKRVEPLCKYLDCGGCDLMHMKYDDQLIYKENKIKEIMNRFTHIDINVKSIIPSDLNYRNKATFQVKESIGYYKKKSYDIINIDECIIVDDRINNILNLVKKNNLSNIYQIVIRVGSNESMIIFKVNGKYDINLDLFKDIDNLIICDNNKYSAIKGKGFIVENIGNYKYIISPDSFFQVNSKCVYNLYNKVKEYVKESDNLLDLYCGTGTIGIFLSDVAKKITGIEINKYAIKDAEINKELNGINNINFICNDVSLLEDNFIADTIIVDPPRSGLDNKAIDFIYKISPKKIVYVSCDPVTLARDLNILNEKYNVLELTPVDMFPYTCHVESVVLLERR